MRAEDVKREKARGLRYKKPMVKDFCLSTITEFLEEMTYASDEVTYFFQDGDMDLLEEMLGDDSDAREFQFAFSGLSADCERMWEDIQSWENNELLEEWFDLFFAASYTPGMGEMLGFDTYEGDYYGLDGISPEWASSEAEKKLTRVTKAELISIQRLCNRVLISYMGLMDRFQSLHAVLEIVRGENREILNTAKRINELYEKIQGDKYAPEHKEFDHLLEKLPAETWLY